MNPVESVRQATHAGKLLPSAATNIGAWLAAGLPSWVDESIRELIELGSWPELNERFFRSLQFGTAGMRGRTIGGVSAPSERGVPGLFDAPEHSAVGSNMMNDVNVAGVCIGLFAFVRKWRGHSGDSDRPRLVIGHDARYFSQYFAELIASTWLRLGGEAHLFNGPRSTPQLSFGVRRLEADCGIMVTASHNPPTENGLKVYLRDGGQIVPPFDRAIVEEITAVPLSSITPYLTINLAHAIRHDADLDIDYLRVARWAVLDAAEFRTASLKAVVTNLHGIGARATIRLLEDAGVDVVQVPEQAALDPRFPTVESPNPENRASLALAIALGERLGADLVLATDPDGDRMAAAVRSRDGRMEVLSGNQTGSLLAEYRTAKYKELGLIPKEGAPSAVIIKTVVTTKFQDAIAGSHGVGVVDTLTGCKWIAAKMNAYEQRLREALGPEIGADTLPFAERARLQLRHGRFCILGNEESCGFLPNDVVRDKDGNTACLMFAEFCAHAKTRGLTVPEYLDQLYLKHGVFLEETLNLYYEGAQGEVSIQQFLGSFRQAPPIEFGGLRVVRFTDYGRNSHFDAEGEEMPKQDLYFLELEGGYSAAVRRSGTEPKVKIYLFAWHRVTSAAELPSIKAAATARLAAMRSVIESDPGAR